MDDFMMGAATPAIPAEGEVVDPAADKFLYERVARVDSPKYSCRVWCGDALTTPIDELRLLVESMLFYLEALGEATSDDVASVLHQICAIDGMNSVEITLKTSGVGMCVHKNWP